MRSLRSLDDYEHVEFIPQIHYGSLVETTWLLDRMHLHLPLRNLNFKLAEEFHRLSVGLDEFFRDKILIRSVTSHDVYVALTYTDYILSYLVFTNVHPVDVPNGLRSVISLLKDRVGTMAYYLQRDYEDTWCVYNVKKERRIFRYLTHFEKLLSMKKDGALVMIEYDFPKFLAGREIDDHLRSVYTILTAPGREDNDEFTSELMANFCQRVDTLRLMQLPMYILDLLFILAHLCCQRKLNYPVEGADSYTTEWFVRWSIITCNLLKKMAVLSKVRYVHRYERLKLILHRTKRNAIDFDTNADDHSALPRFDTFGLPKFLNIPAVGEIPSVFWKQLRSKRYELEAADGEFFCGVCQVDDLKLEDCAILGSCTHKFCETCIKGWFHNNRTCPLCREVVYSWTNRKLAKAYVDNATNFAPIETRIRRRSMISRVRKRIRRLSNMFSEYVDFMA